MPHNFSEDLVLRSDIFYSATLIDVFWFLIKSGYLILQLCTKWNQHEIQLVYVEILTCAYLHIERMILLKYLKI